MLVGLFIHAEMEMEMEMVERWQRVLRRRLAKGKGRRE